MKSLFIYQLIARLIVVVSFLTIAFVSRGQKSDSAMVFKSIIDHIELEQTAVVYISNEATADVGGGLKLGCHISLLDSRLRIGLDVGYGFHRYNYHPENGNNNPDILLRMSAVNFDLTYGTDLLPKKRTDLILGAGVRMFIPVGGSYGYYNLGYPQKDVVYDIDKKFFPAALCKIVARFPIGPHSCFSLGYLFSFTFGNLEQVPNAGVGYVDNVGKEHQINFGYCYYFAALKKR
ncbi:MAG: hypothetical protein K9J17_11695 [Flavobacteriales bacterium]|nr:hypothetical protein [Flavobacteriales bacterium]